MRNDSARDMPRSGFTPRNMPPMYGRGRIATGSKGQRGRGVIMRPDSL